MGNIAAVSRGVFGSKCNILIRSDSVGILFGHFSVRLFHIKCLSGAFPAHETWQNGIACPCEAIAGLCNCPSPLYP